jgi:hypothetical protein
MKIKITKNMWEKIGLNINNIPQIREMISGAFKRDFDLGISY